VGTNYVELLFNCCVFQSLLGFPIRCDIHNVEEIDIMVSVSILVLVDVALRPSLYFYYRNAIFKSFTISSNIGRKLGRSFS